MNNNGLIVYTGPSMLHGQSSRNIVAYLTGITQTCCNHKTGDMTQLWIMSADAAPNEALKTGADIAVCGACPLRGKTCYVEIGKAPRSVWLAGNSGKYRTLANAKEAQRLLIGLKPMRLGAYGDPAALPEAVIKELADLSHGNYTGYTHQWRDPENRWL